ncbi:calcineurin-binding protein cabin-1, partial [Nephila pilipes]
MMKFSALNESSLSDDNGDPELASREAQEEEAYSLYHLALKKQSEGKIEEAEEMLKEVLEMDFLTQAQPDEDTNEAPLGSALTLKYLLYKNLANISIGKKDSRAAVEYFLEALEIDPTDVYMWYQMGKASINISNYSLARLCFEEGLKCNPNHWPCLDNVITVMYTLNDYANCLYYISKALERECYYLKGLAFKDEIYREDPSLKSFCEGYFKKCDSSIHSAEYDQEEAKKFIQESLDMRVKKQSFYKPTPLPVISLSLPIKENTWKNLGESLISTYNCIANASTSVSFSCKIDLSPYIENANKGQDDKFPSPSSVSSLSEACSSNSAAPPFHGSNVPKSEGLLQLAAVPPDDYRNRRNSVVEMDVEETPPTSNINSSPYTLVLPPVEIQPTDLSMCTDSTSSNRRTSKRKRLLSELTELSAKRRSSRVRNPAVKKPQDNINYQELLQKFLPPKLIGDGKCEDPDDDSEPTSLDKTGGDLSYGQSSENDKSGNPSGNARDLVWSEKDDVCLFIANNQSNAGIIDLLYKYVVFLGRKNTCIWPKNLIDVFCEAFSKLRNHLTIPNLFSHSTDRDRIKEMGMAILSYCEFKVDKWYLSTGHSMSFSPKASAGNVFQNGNHSIGNDFHSDMEFLVMLTVRRDVLEKDWLNYSARALWLKAKFHSLEGEIELAICCMEKLSDVLCEENDIKITIQNSGFSNFVTADKVQQQLESLQRCQSLEEVQRLYEHGDYEAVVNLLILTFNQPRTKRKQSLDGVPERHAQLLLLQNSLLKLERYRDCVFWSEVSFNEALQQFMNAARSDWSETMAHLLHGLDKCIKLNPKYLGQLEESKLVRLTQNLILVIVIQMENYDFSSDNASLLIVLPWKILFHLILNEEKRTPKKAAKVDLLNSAMPSSLMLLFSAHEYLGRRSWCTTADGLLLFHIIDVSMTELQDTTGKSYLYKEELEAGLEQCIYCLYGHPHKRTRAKHLQEHNARQIPLTWEKACLIFQYFKPNVLPEFDSYRTSTVSAELESLLKRISALVPPEQDPTTRVDNYTAYIEGVTEKCPEAPFKDKPVSDVVKDLYYLLGDYYFKNKEFSKAIKFYLMDICISPDRQDSWAGMALSRSSQLDQKLNSYELRNESTIYRKSVAALKCFEHSLELDSTTTSLWIEHGSLAYILHSHASRQLKQEAVCDELNELLKKKKLEMLQVAEKCFSAANRCDDGGEPEEAWLHHYMLGKICEKKGEGPSIYLDHFQKALMYLHEDFARYPQKIQYHNPLELSIEALEVYYRVHASVLKFLWKHEDLGVDLATLKIIKQCLVAVAKSPFANYQEKCKKEISCSSSPHSEAEDYESPSPEKPVEPIKIIDHNYYDDIQKPAQKISEDSKGRQSRTSIDSSPETLENVSIKEVMDSLVGVVAEHFIDVETEKANAKKNFISNSKKDSGLIIESVAEESVYTTKPISTCSTIPDPISESIKNLEKETDLISKQIKMDIESEARKNREEGQYHNGMFASNEKETVIEEKDELTKQQELALELETEAAASKLVEEMRLESDALGDMDYCNYDMYSIKPEEDPMYYECMDYSYEIENVAVEEPFVDNQIHDDILLTMSSVLDKLKEGEVSSLNDNEMLDETIESTTRMGTNDIELVVKTINSEVKDVSKILDSEKITDTGELCLVKDKVALEMTANTEIFEEKCNIVSSVTGNTSELDSKPQNASRMLTTESDIQGKDKNETECDIEIIVSEKSLKELSSDVSESIEQHKKQNLTSDEVKADVSIDSLNLQNKEIKSKDINKNADEKSNAGTSHLKESRNSENGKKGKAEKERSSRKKTSETSPVAKETVLPPTPEELLFSQQEIAELIPICLDAMRECLQRFIQHYKSLYRMAHYYCHSKKNKNLQWAREILLAATPSTKKYPSMPGLFADRKNTNFFNGIWRAPSNEIDRPGSFGSHMYRSIALLIQVLTEQKDYNMLVFLTQQLYRTPDLGKKYMRDTDRVYLVRRAYDCCINILRDQMNSLLQEEPPPEESRLICCLLEIYRSCQTLLKAGIFVDETNDLLEEAYTMYRMGEVDSHPSVLEQATKFCQIQLGKSYPQSAYEFTKSSSKYMPVLDSENNLNVPMPSVSAYTPDAWQKEFSKSVMMPVIPCKPRLKQEVEPVQDPLILIPMDGKFNSHLGQSTSSAQCPAVSTQMVHVEKPKAENLQACSVAFLPVAPVFSKDAINLPNTVQATSLLSCQTYECFDVLTSIMQASGYKVAPQTVISQQVKDNNSPINLVKAKTTPYVPAPKGNVGRPKKRKRKAPVPKMEALNLCKRISTKPIVSTSIAHSIAELKVGNITTNTKTAPVEVTTSSRPIQISKVADNSSSKNRITSIRSCDTSSNISLKANLTIPTTPKRSILASISKDITMKDNSKVLDKPAFPSEVFPVSDNIPVKNNNDNFEKSHPFSAQAIKIPLDISPKDHPTVIRMPTSPFKSTQMLNTLAAPETNISENTQMSTIQLESTQTLENSFDISKNIGPNVTEIPAASLESTNLFDTSFSVSKKEDFQTTETFVSPLESTQMFETSINVSKKDNLLTQMHTSPVQSNPMFQTSLNVCNKNKLDTEMPNSLLQSTETFEKSVNKSEKCNLVPKITSLESTQVFETSINKSKKNNLVPEIPTSPLKIIQTLEIPVNESKANHLVTEIPTSPLQSFQMIESSVKESKKDNLILETSLYPLESTQNKSENESTVSEIPINESKKDNLAFETPAPPLQFTTVIEIPISESKKNDLDSEIPISSLQSTQFNASISESKINNLITEMPTSPSQSTEMFEMSINESKKGNLVHEITTSPLHFTHMLETLVNESKEDYLVTKTPTSPLQSTQMLEMSIKESEMSNLVSEIPTSSLQSTQKFEISVGESKKDNLASEISLSPSSLQSTQIFDASINQFEKENHVHEILKSSIQSTEMLETSITGSEKNNPAPEIPISQLQSTPWFEISISESKRDNYEIRTSQFQSSPMFETSILESKKDKHVPEIPTSQLQSTPWFEISINESKRDNPEIPTSSMQSTEVLETSISESKNSKSVPEIPTPQLQSTPWLEITINESKKNNSEISTSQLQSTEVLESSISELKNIKPVPEIPISQLQSTPWFEISISKSKEDNS